MKIHPIKLKPFTIKRLQKLLEGNKKQIYGVSYINSYLTKRHICRNNAEVRNIDIEQGIIDVDLTVRVEDVGATELDITRNMLVTKGLGEITNNYIPDNVFEKDSEHIYNEPVIVENVSITQGLRSVDISLTFDEPTLTTQDFSIAGSKFTLVNIKQYIEDENFEHTITLLFGDTGKLNILSHFYDKDLTSRDAKLIMQLVMDNNLTGKALSGVRYISKEVDTTLFPLENLITPFVNSSGNYVFASGTGYIVLSRSEINKITMYVYVDNSNGTYTITIEGKDYKLILMLD